MTTRSARYDQLRPVHISLVQKHFGQPRVHGQYNRKAWGTALQESGYEQAENNTHRHGELKSEFNVMLVRITGCRLNHRWLFASPAFPFISFLLSHHHHNESIRLGTSIRSAIYAHVALFSSSFRRLSHRLFCLCVHCHSLLRRPALDTICQELDLANRISFNIISTNPAA